MTSWEVKIEPTGDNTDIKRFPPKSEYPFYKDIFPFTLKTQRKLLFTFALYFIKKNMEDNCVTPFILTYIASKKIRHWKQFLSWVTAIRFCF